MTPEERRDVPRRLDAARNAREERVKRTEQTELENARQVIRELREELEARGLPDEEGCKAARVEAARLRAEVDGLQLELEAVRSAKNADCDLYKGERDEANKSLAECRRVWQGFINDCASLLGLPKLDGCSEYGGGAIRKGITEVKKRLDAAELTADGVAEGSAEWEEEAKMGRAEVQRLRGALEKINEIRNDIIGRQSVNWSAHIYPLVAALDEAGFKGLPYDKARERVEATIKAARGMAAQAWCTDETREMVMNTKLCDAFAEILFTFLEALEFYALLGNWQDMKGGQKESACDHDLGSRARAALGRPDRDVMEIIEDDDSPVSRARGKPCSHPACTKDAEWVIVSGHTKDDWREACTAHVGELLPDGQEHKVYPVDQGQPDEHSGTGGGPSGDGS